MAIEQRIASSGRHANTNGESSSLSTYRPSKEEEAHKIETLNNTATSHANCYLRRNWWERWTRWVGYPPSENAAPSGTEPPGPVEKATEGDDADRVVICQSAFEQLVRWYTLKTDPATQPPSLTLRFFKKRPTKPISRRFPSTAKINEVLSKVSADLLTVQRGPVYLFDPVSRRDFFLTDERTLAELGIADNSVFCLLSFNGLGRKAGKVGLINIGNTCYMNSSLQCLLHTPELMHYFLTEKYLSDVRPQNPDGCGGHFADQFHELMQRVWDTDMDYTNPSAFWEILSKYYPLFAEKDHHDTAELAETVLDGLMEDCNLATIPKPYYPEIKEDANMTDSEMAEMCWSYHKGRSSSFITDRFHGQYRILTKCPECGFESRKFDSFTVLHLGLPPPKTRVIVFTLVEVTGESLPEKFGIELSSNVLVKDLYLEAAQLIGCDEEKPWTELCFVLNRSTLIFLQLQDPIARISDYDEVLLYSYKGSDYGPSSGGRKTCFVHQKLVPFPHYGSYCYSFATQREEKQEFGYPLVLWLPCDDDLSSSKKRSILQDILEHSLRPFKRAHMAALHEAEEQKEASLYVADADVNDMEHEVSDAGSNQAQPDSPRALSAHSDPGDPHEHTVPEDEQAEHEEIPDAEMVEGDMHTFRNDLDGNAEPSDQMPGDVEMTTLKTFPDIPVGPLPDEEPEEGSIDDAIKGLFEEPDTTVPLSQQPHVSTAAYISSSSSSPNLAFGPLSPSEAYKLSESKIVTRADEARTIVVDWDSNADQYYNLHNLEHPLLHRTAQGVDDRRRKTAESVTIYDCLHHEFSPHPCALDGDNLWKCGGCKEMVNGVKSMRLWKTPDILLIGLKRFDYCEARDRLIKLDQMVTFPLNDLDLTDYYAPIRHSDAIYDLYGVCHHHGHGPKMGHYTSSVKSPGGKWHKFNDSWCTEISEANVVTQDAYLLYYRKRDLPFPGEKAILEMFTMRERRQCEDQAVMLYKSELADGGQGASDEDTTMMSATYSQFGKAADPYKTENGSSSSNEMNNENEMNGLSSQGHGSSSYYGMGESSQYQAATTSAFYGPHYPKDITRSNKGDSGFPVGWSNSNSKALIVWQSAGDIPEEPLRDVEDSHLDPGQSSTPWQADLESGSLTLPEEGYDMTNESTAMDNEMQESYDASMYEGPQTENETQGSYDATMYESFQVDRNKND